MKVLMRQFGLELLLLSFLAVFFHFFGNGSGDSGSLFLWWKTGSDPIMPWAFGFLLLLVLWFFHDMPLRVFPAFISMRRSGGATCIVACVFLLTAVAGYVFGFPEVSNIALFGFVGGIFRLRLERGLLILFFGACFSPQWLFGWVSPWLQQGSAVILEILLSLFGMEVLREGTSIFLPIGTSVHIAEECSGIRGMELFFCLAVVLCIPAAVRSRGIWLTVAMVIGLSILANLMRMCVVAVCVTVWGWALFARAHEQIAPLISYITFSILYLYLTKQIWDRTRCPPPEELDERHALLRGRRVVFCFVTVAMIAAAGLCSRIGRAHGGSVPDWVERSGEIEVVDAWRRGPGSFCNDLYRQCLVSFPAVMTGSGNTETCACGEMLARRDRTVCHDQEGALRKVRWHYSSLYRPDVGVALLEGWSAESPASNPEWFLRNELGAKILSKKAVEISALEERGGAMTLVQYVLPGRLGQGVAAYGFSDGRGLYATRLQYGKAVWTQQLRHRTLSPDYTLFIHMRHPGGNAATTELLRFIRAYLPQQLGVIPDQTAPDKTPESTPLVHK